MDADKAAAIAKALPDDYVKRVFSQMPPDAVSDILSELPAKTAARLIQAATDVP
jgi:flagellar motility protein MotE (MotC chaperone)